MLISEFISKHEVSFTFKLEAMNAKTDDGWVHDVWTVKINDRYEAPFRMGVGYRKKVGAPSGTRTKPPQSGTVYERGRGAQVMCIYDRGEWWTPTEPKPAEVLHSLAMDAGAAQETFEDWCANFGYDSDSRRAERTYNACRDTFAQLAQLFGLETVAELLACEEG